jgi:hypothetical protein
MAIPVLCGVSRTPLDDLIGEKRKSLR